jgi:hypothetical protein
VEAVVERTCMAVEGRSPVERGAAAKRRASDVRGGRPMEGRRAVTAVSRRRGHDTGGAGDERDETEDGH